jgi:hypothetical protein
MYQAAVKSYAVDFDPVIRNKALVGFHLIARADRMFYSKFFKTSAKPEI